MRLYNHPRKPANPHAPGCPLGTVVHGWDYVVTPDNPVSRAACDCDASSDYDANGSYGPGLSPVTPGIAVTDSCAVGCAALMLGSISLIFLLLACSILLATIETIF